MSRKALVVDFILLVHSQHKVEGLLFLACIVALLTVVDVRRAVIGFVSVLNLRWDELAVLCG